MASNHNLGGNYWGYLINPDKSAAPLLDQLCVGLAKTIAQLEPANAGPKNKLTPQRLAAFYRSVGGNYDPIFNTSSNGLSFMYTTLGCFHTLQPTPNPHEPPSIPALTSRGFVKWQTIQLLLSPNDHAPFLQKAVRQYDVLRPDGGSFPKHIPREAFPEKPDEEMERWHSHITGRLTQETEIRRLKNSPYPSPYPPVDRDGYFSPNGKLPLPQIRRPSRASRAESHDQDLTRRRSSVPDLPSPQPSGADALQWATDQHGRLRDPKKRSSRSHSAHRATNSSSQHRQSSGSSGQRQSNSSNRTSNPSTSYRPNNGNLPNAPGMQPHGSHNHQRNRSGNHRQRSPSTINESSGSEASSETSPGPERKSRRSSLRPPDLLNHKRRHSHDASYVAPERKPALPPRPSENKHHTRQRSGTQIQDSPNRHSFHPHQSPVFARPPALNTANGVRFRDRIFDSGRENAVNSEPELPPSYPYIGPSRPAVSQPRPVDPPPPNPRYIMDSTAPLSRESSGSSGNGTERGSPRSSGLPLRVQTVSGVGGRRYLNLEHSRSAVEGRNAAPLPV